eukprot:scaffold71061_cov83-Phaeocystis_antarctica.AAC.1
MSWPGVPRYASRSVQRMPLPLCRVSRQLSIVVETSAPEWLKGGFWGRLAQTLEAVAGRSVGRSLPWERRASQSCKVHPEEAQEPTSGTAKGAVGPCGRASGLEAGRKAAHLGLGLGLGLGSGSGLGLGSGS